MRRLALESAIRGRRAARPPVCSYVRVCGRLLMADYTPTPGTLTPDEFQQVRAIFEAALQRSADERREFVAQSAARPRASLKSNACSQPTRRSTAFSIRGQPSAASPSRETVYAARAARFSA